MHAIINSDGGVYVESSDPTELATFIRALRFVVEVKPDTLQKLPKTGKQQAKSLPDLPPTLEEVHSWMIHNNDLPMGQGRTRNEIADALGLKVITTDTRLRLLKKRGLVTQPARGIWALA